MKKLKVLFAAILVFASLSFVNVNDATAASNITIYVNNEKQSYSDKAVIKSGSTLVPLRGIFEALGANVTWNAASKTIDASKDNTTIWLAIGSKATKVNGNTVNIDVPAQVANGNTLVPLRFIGEALGANVSWDSKTKTISITSSLSNNQTDSAKSMKVHFIDVGQGDSTFIQLANGKTALIDAGTDANGETVVAYLKSLGVKKLDYVIATHPDADHIGGMVDVINAFTIGTFIDSGKVHTTQTFENMLHAIDKKNIKYINPKKGQVFEYDESIESYFQVLHVDANASDNNDASIVIKGGYCNKDLALMGDAGVDIESKILNTFDNLGVEILKAGHHGSNTSSSLEFLKATSPEAVILSYGADNNYGHPHQEVLANIKAIGAKAYSTAQEGTIIATINCEGVKIDSKEFEVPAEIIQPKPTPAPVPQPENKFNNCEELTKVHPEGVMVGHAAYESKLDRDGDGHACEPFENDSYTPPVITPTPVPTPQPTPEPVQTGFKNCTELRKVYPSGVSSSHPAYESKMDRDGDGYACE